MESVYQLLTKRSYATISEEETPCIESKLVASSSQLDEMNDVFLRLSQLNRRLRVLYILSITLAVLLSCVMTLWIRLNIIHLTNILPSDVSRKSCGSSIAEAKSLGCSFDILSKAWLPPDCSRLGSEEYIRDSWSWNHTGWGIYADRMQTHELTMEELVEYADSGLKWYGTEREHLVHCAWGLKRVLDAYVNEKRMDYIIQQLHHTTHCVDRLYMSAVKAPDLDIVLGKGNIRFGLC